MMLTHHSEEVGDAVQCVWFAGPRPAVKEVVYVDFKVLEVILVLLQRGQLHVGNHASLLIHTTLDLYNI